MIKKILKSWKISAIIMIISVILNIVLLCQPVVGTYTGATKYSDYYYSSSFNTEIHFDGGYATIKLYRQGENPTYYAGIYKVIDDEIRLIVFNYTEFSSFFNIEPLRETYTRNSVFSISYGENQYTSGLAIFLQIFYAIVELIFLIRFILQFSQFIKERENLEEQNNVQSNS